MLLQSAVPRSTREMMPTHTHPSALQRAPLPLDLLVITETLLTQDAQSIGNTQTMPHTHTHAHSWHEHKQAQGQDFFKSSRQTLKEMHLVLPAVDQQWNRFWKANRVGNKVNGRTVQWWHLSFFLALVSKKQWFNGWLTVFPFDPKWKRLFCALPRDNVLHQY